MAKKRQAHDLGIRLKPTDTAGTLEGEISIGKTSKFVKVFVDGSEREMLSKDQTQTVTNKVIDVDNNTISNIETDNLKAGVLNTDLSGAATDTEIPSALAVKSALALQNEADEITYDPSGSTLISTDVQTAVDETVGRLDTTETVASGADSKVDAHIIDATDAHSGSAITNTPSGNLVATTVQDALNEIQTEVDGKASATALSDHIGDVTDAHSGSSITNIPAGNLASTDIQGAVNELQTDVDTRALALDLTNHENATVAHGATGAVVGTTNTQNLTNKTVTGALNITPTQDDTKQDTQANLETYALTATNGQFCFATDTKKMYQIVDNALTAVGGGAGGINYIENFDFEVNANDWVSDVNFTIARTISSPLRGAGSGLLSKGAVDSSGQVVTVPFTIDAADNSQKLYIEFDQEISANHADGDVRVEIVKDPNGTPVTIRCNGEDLQGTRGKHLAWFQADASIVEYELVFKVVTVNAAAYTIKIDNVQVGPRDSSYLSADEMLAEGAGNNAAVMTAGVTNINFTKTSDKLGAFDGTTYIAPSTGLYFVTGNCRFTAAIDAVISFYIDGTIKYGLAGNVGSVQSHQLSGSIFLNKGEALTLRTNTTGTLQNNTQLHNIQLSGPNPTRISEDIGNRNVVVRGAGNSGSAITANVTPINFTETEDTANAFDGDTFTAPETGRYSFEGGTVATAVTQYYLNTYISTNDGASYSLYRRVSPYSSTNTINSFSGTFSLNKGDKIQIRSTAGFTLSNTTIHHWISINKLAQPQTIRETATVAARYTSNSGQTIVNTAAIVYEDIDYDTHNAYVSGVYTAPISGYYNINATVRPSGSFSISIACEVNGVKISRTPKSSAGDNNVITLVDTPYLNTGDTLEITQDSGVSRTITSTGTENIFTIARIK